MSNTYQLSTSPSVISHGFSFHGLLRDQDDNLELRARVKSGDYFASLATDLDKIASGTTHSPVTKSSLENIVKELLYLQEHYVIQPAVFMRAVKKLKFPLS